MNKTFSFMREKDNEKENLSVKIVSNGNCSKGQFSFEITNQTYSVFFYKSNIITTGSDWTTMNMILKQIEGFMREKNIQQKNDFTKNIWTTFFNYKQPTLDGLKMPGETKWKK
ncbi:MAG: hypothetical protein MJ179_00865 [Treponema sp.]|nr:hypothetical protein [Treponema sp.]